MVCKVAISTAAPTISPEARQLWNSCRNKREMEREREREKKKERISRR